MRKTISQVSKGRRSTVAMMVVLAAAFLPVATLAQAGEIVSVTASGYGVSLEAAKKAAGRAAIEQVVGQIVDAETLVENDELVKDRILTYSGAFLEDIDVVGKPTLEDGLWTVKILAKVRKTTLQQKLAAENVGKAKLKKGKLFAQATSKAQEADDAGAVLAAAFEGFPKNVVKFEVCKNADGTPAVSVSSAGGNVVVEVELSFDKEAWKAWSSALILKLEKMASGGETAKWDVDREEDDGRGIYQDGKKLFLQGARMKNRWGLHDSSEGFRFAVAPGADQLCDLHIKPGRNSDAAPADQPRRGGNQPYRSCCLGTKASDHSGINILHCNRCQLCQDCREAQT